MQKSLLPQLPLLHSSFQQHRPSLDTLGFAIDLTLPKPTAAPFWASLPSPPMSGSSPPEPPSDPPQIAGRRRKRSHTPPTTTTRTGTTTGPTLATSPTTPSDQPLSRLEAQARGGETRADLAYQPGSYVSTYPVPTSYHPASSSSTVAITDPEFLSQSPISPRATRKPKPHVTSACINCKKKHLRCDDSRPCKRCVSSAKEDSCRDVEHKKRGRPPLKPEDPSARRQFESLPPGGLGYPPRTTLLGGDPSNLLQQSTSYPPIRPFHSPNYPRPPQFPGGIYAPPSISPSRATAMGTFVPPSQQYPSGPPPIVPQSPTMYNPTPPDPSLRSMASYSSPYNFPPIQSQMIPVSYSNPIFPRPPPSSSLPNESLTSMEGPASLQLPPIRLSPSGIGPIDPAISEAPYRPQILQPSQTEQIPGGDDGTQEPDPKRPKMDIQGILGPRDRE